MSSEIRLGEVHDVPQLIKLEEQCFDGDRIGKLSFQRFVSSSSAQVWLFEPSPNIELAAYAIVLTRKNSKWQRVYSIATAPSFRGQGLGKRLLLHIIDVAQKREAKGLRLEVKTSNQKAIEIYRALEFEVIDLLPAYYEDESDGYRMQLTLSTGA